MRFIGTAFVCTECGGCNGLPYGADTPCLPTAVHEARRAHARRQEQIEEQWKSSSEYKKAHRKLEKAASVYKQALKEYDEAKKYFCENHLKAAERTFVTEVKAHWNDED